MKQMIINSFYCQTGDESNLNKLYFVEISDIINANNFERLLSFVSEENREKVKRFHFDIDKKLSLYAEVIIRMTACQTLGIKNDEIKFEKGEHGKPHLKRQPLFLQQTFLKNSPYGINIYSQLSRYLAEKADFQFMEYKQLHFLYQHKAGILRSFQFLLNNNYIDGEMNSYIEQYKVILDQAYKLRMLALKLTLTHDSKLKQRLCVTKLIY